LLGRPTHRTDDEEADQYYRVVRLSNGERVGIECGLATSPTRGENFVMHLLQGHGRIYGLWVFARESFAHSDDMVLTALTSLVSIRS
jgi:hypothetical protein